MIIITRPPKKPPVAMLALMFFIFMSCGFLASYQLSIEFLTKWVKARSWISVPCTIQRSELKKYEQAGNDEYDYGFLIFYSYDYGGVSYDSAEYDFMYHRSSDYNRTMKIINLYPPGKKTICYINPDKPQEAVLNRGLTYNALLAILYPLIFFFIGLTGLLVTWHCRKYIKTDK